MRFTLIGSPGVVFTADRVMEVAGIRCVHGTATAVRMNTKRTRYVAYEVETTARIEDVEIVPDVTVNEVAEAA